MKSGKDNGHSKLSIEFVKNIMNSSLLKNAGYIFLGVNFIPSLFGFLFWTISSRFYSASDVGVAAAILSAISLVSLLASLGTNIGIIRFVLASENPNRMINSVLNVNIIVSVALVIFYFIGLPLWGEGINGELHKPLALLLFSLTVILSTLGTTIRDGLIGLQNSKSAFIYMLVFNLLRVCFVYFGIEYKNLGLLGSITFGYVIANLLGVIILLPRASMGFFYSFRIVWEDIKMLLPFSGANYFATIILNLPTTLLPILTIAILGADANAYSYIVMMAGLMIASPGISLASSAFSQGSFQYKNAWPLLRKAVIISISTTCIISLLSALFAHWLLSIFGAQYANHGTVLFYWLALSAPISVMNQMLITYFRLKLLNIHLVTQNLICAVVSILGALLLLPIMGITGNGLSFFLGNLMAFMFGIIALKLVGFPNEQN